MNNTYLAHHGILGMKWGVRRSEAQLARARGHSSKSSDDKNEVSARKAAVKNRRTSGKKALTVAAAGAMTYAVKTAMTKEFNLKEAAQYIAANPNKKK